MSATVNLFEYLSFLQTVTRLLIAERSLDLIFIVVYCHVFNLDQLAYYYHCFHVNLSQPVPLGSSFSNCSEIEPLGWWNSFCGMDVLPAPKPSVSEH